MWKAIVGIVLVVLLGVWFFRERTFFTTERPYTTEPKYDVRIYHSDWAGDTILMPYPAATVQQAKNAARFNTGAAMAPPDPMKQFQGDDPGSRLVGEQTAPALRPEIVESEEHGAKVVASPRGAIMVREGEIGGETHTVKVTWHATGVAEVLLDGEPLEQAVFGQVAGIPIGWTITPNGPTDIYR